MRSLPAAPVVLGLAISACGAPAPRAPLLPSVAPFDGGATASMPKSCGAGDVGSALGLPLAAATGPGPWRLSAADVDGDGKLDLLVANGGFLGGGAPQPPGSSVTILYGRGDGTFRGSIQLPTQPGTVNVLAGDFGGAGPVELAVASCAEAPDAGGGAVQLFVQQANGLYAANEAAPLSGCPYGLAAGDFNHDGRLDLVAATPGPFGGAAGLVLLYNHGGPVPGPPIRYATAAAQDAVAVADLQGKGSTDLVSVGEDSTLSVWLNDGSGDFTPLGPVLLPGGPYDALVLADLDGDGRLDVAAISTQGGDLAVLRGLGGGRFLAPAVMPLDRYPLSISAADFDGDGTPDLAVGYAGGFVDGVDLLLGQDGGFASPQRLLTGGSAFGTLVGDFDGDGRPDLAVAVNDLSVAELLLDACGASGPGADAGTGTFQEAEHTPLPLVPDNGGPVLPAPQLVTIHYQGDPSLAHNEAYDDWIAGSDWLRTVGASYGVAPGISLAKVVLSGPAPQAMSDGDVQALLLDEIDAGVLPPPGPGDGGFATGLLYVLYLPAQTTVSGGNIGTSCQSFGGYHSEDDLGPVAFPYAVVPFCYGSQDEQDIAASHELIEASTDPFPMTAPAWVFQDFTQPWTFVPGEVGDLCTETAVVQDGFLAQRIWSNDSAAAGQAPCAPVPDGPYFNVSPSPGDTAAVRPGQTLTFQLTGWSTEAMEPWAVKLIPLYGAYAFGNAFVPELDLDRLILGNGEAATLTVGVPSDAPHGSLAAFAIYSARSDRDQNGGYWPFLIRLQ